MDLVELDDLKPELTKLHPNIAANIEAILSELAQGQIIKKVREKYHIPEHAWRKSNLRSSLFNRAVIFARSQGYDEIADSLLEIPDTYNDVQRANLKSANIKFLLGKRKPEVYGERVDINLKGSIDLVGAIREAQDRVLRPVRDLTQALPPLDPIDSSDCDDCATDSQSDDDADPFS